jgi:hypothetical protein
MRNERTDGAEALKLALLTVPAIIAILAGRTEAAHGATALLIGLAVALGLGLAALATRQLTIRPFGR